MEKKRKPILVTGSHRSGSTWAGQMLAASPRTGYIHEPFNTGIKIGALSTPFKHWFQYIGEENSFNYKATLDSVINFKYPLNINLAKVSSAGDIKRITREQGRFLWHRLSTNTPIFKDPLALFSAEWLSKEFDMNVLVMIRHPAAFCLSLKVKNWKFDFNNFLEQPLLMNKYLHEFKEDIHEYAQNEKDILDQAILLWNCIHHTISIYKESHPEWLFVKHEYLSLEPVNQFQLIYETFGLEFTDKARSIILRSSSSNNPVEFNTTNQLLRNSKENIYKWKKILTENEIEKIKQKTSNVFNLLYTQEQW